MNKMLILATACLLAGEVLAQYTNRSSVMDCSGRRSAGGSYTILSAAGQPGGIKESNGGSYVNQAGFLNTFFLRPDLDTDGNGLPDEADPDNDDDGLADVAEILGDTFDPVTPTEVNLADSDGDGASDWEESVAGTNPRNEDSLLELNRIARGIAVDVAWVARSNKTYRVLSASAPGRPLTNVVAEVLVSGMASPPWYVATGSVSDASANLTRVYAVEVLP